MHSGPWRLIFSLTERTFSTQNFQRIFADSDSFVHYSFSASHVIMTRQPRCYTRRTLYCLYALGLVCRLILALVPLSILHPDELVQSVQPSSSSSLLLPASNPISLTWDWRYTCVNASLPAHVSPLTPRSFDTLFLDSLDRGSSGTGRDSALLPSFRIQWNVNKPPPWMTCQGVGTEEDGSSGGGKYDIQMPIRGVIAPSVKTQSFPTHS